MDSDKAKASAVLRERRLAPEQATRIMRFRVILGILKAKPSGGKNDDAIAFGIYLRDRDFLAAPQPFPRAIISIKVVPPPHSAWVKWLQQQLHLGLVCGLSHPSPGTDKSSIPAERIDEHAAACSDFQRFIHPSRIGCSSSRPF